MGDPAGLAALSVCESMLLSLIDNGALDKAEAQAVLVVAAATHRHAMPWAGRRGDDHKQAAMLIKRMLAGGDPLRL